MRKLFTGMLLLGVAFSLLGCGKTVPPDVTIKKLTMQAMALSQQNKFPEAEKAIQQALDLTQEHLLVDDPLRLNIQMTAGGIYFNEGKYAEAETYFRQVATGISEKGGKEDAQIIAPLNGLAVLYEKQGKDKEALETYKRILRLTQNVNGEFHPEVGGVYNKMATIAFNLKDYRTAEEYYRKLIEVAVRVYGKDHIEVAKVLEQVSLFYKLTGYADASAEAAGNAKKIRDESKNRTLTITPEELMKHGKVIGIEEVEEKGVGNKE